MPMGLDFNPGDTAPPRRAVAGGPAGLPAVPPGGGGGGGAGSLAVLATPAVAAIARTPADPGDFAGSGIALPADRLPSRVLATMADIYRAKYGLAFGTLEFVPPQAKATEVRAVCDALPPGQCALLLATTAGGVHAFVAVAVRRPDGRAACLLADSTGTAFRNIVKALEAVFPAALYVTPRIQRSHQIGCMVYALRFLLMSRNPALGGHVQAVLSAFDAEARDDTDTCRQLDADDLRPLAGYLALTGYRDQVRPNPELMRAPLENGGRHDRWTLAEFQRQRPPDLVLQVRRMYDEVDCLLNEPATAAVSPQRQAYLQHRFLQYREAGAPPPAARPPA